MNISNTQDLIVFAAVAQLGTLTAASQRLGLSQPTVGRAIQRLEDVVGGALFVRHGRGMSLTELGEALAPSAEDVAVANEQFWLHHKGLGNTVTGLVRVSTSEVVGVELLMPWVATFQRSHPEAQVALVASNDVTNLERGGADIAIRMFKPQKDALIIQHLGELTMGFYATQAYLDDFQRRPEPRTHRWIGFDRNRFYNERIAEMFEDRPIPAFSFRTDAQLAHIAAVRAGVGVGAILRTIAERDPTLIRVVIEDTTLPALPVWLTTHRELHRSKLLRVTFDSLRDYLRELLTTV